MSRSGQEQDEIIRYADKLNNRAKRRNFERSMSSICTEDSFVDCYEICNRNDDGLSDCSEYDLLAEYPNVVQEDLTKKLGISPI
jgi:hypothetical protein